MKDRFVNGLIGGTIAGVAMNMVNYAAFWLKIISIRYLDWAGILMYGVKPATLREMIFAQVVQLLFSAFVGSVFAYWYYGVSSRYYLTKGLIFGVISWFFMYAAAIIARLPYLTVISFETSLTNFAGSVVYGLVIAETLRHLDHRARV